MNAEPRDISSIVDSVRSGRERACEFVDEALARIAEHDTNAVVTVAADAARAAAAAIDRVAGRGGDPGPLAGVPFTVKDCIAVGGSRSTAGSRLLADHVASHDATVVARLRAAGAIVVGRTNCPEFALQPRTENAVFGRTSHPLDGTRSPGGSSGGCAAAVAGGLVPFSIGGDYGGSVRYPAACTGLYGLRPARGSVPSDGHVPAPAAGSPRAVFQTFGPLARSVEEIAILFRVIAGHRVFASAGESESVPRVGVVRGGWPVSDSVARAMDDVTHGLRAAGVTVGTLDPAAFVDAADLFDIWRATDDYADLRALAAGREALLTPHIARLLASAAQPWPADFARDLDLVRARVDAVFAITPVVCLPVARVGTLPIDAVTVEVSGREEYVDALQILAPSRAVSLLGVPALAVPAGTDIDGFPVGVQLIARLGDEHMLFAVAAALRAVSTPRFSDSPALTAQLDR